MVLARCAANRGWLGTGGASARHLQHLAIEDARVVAEEVLAAVVGLDEAEPVGVPPLSHAGRLAIVGITLPLALALVVGHDDRPWTCATSRLT
jgi:hypothetical protein